MKGTFKKNVVHRMEKSSSNTSYEQKKCHILDTAQAFSYVEHCRITGFKLSKSFLQQFDSHIEFHGLTTMCEEDKHTKLRKLQSNC